MNRFHVFPITTIDDGFGGGEGVNVGGARVATAATTFDNGDCGQGPSTPTCQLGVDGVPHSLIFNLDSKRRLKQSELLALPGLISMLPETARAALSTFFQ